MSQQGIFSIAPDAQPNANGGNNGGGGNGSPFTAVSNDPAQNSPFAAAQDSPFQPALHGQQGGVDSGNRSGIPQRRPEGQPSALGVGVAGGDVPVGSEISGEAQPAMGENNAFTAVNDIAGGAFQMNGFPQHAGGQVMEAAPVAAAHETSPFMAVQDDRPNYEAAKASLEPQQDFAAVQPRYTAAVEPPAPVAQQPVHPVYTPPPAAAVQQPVQSAMVASPPQVQAPVVSPVVPAFQQLELRAIFGVDHILDGNQILQRARTLPGIRNIAVVGNQEAMALSNFRQAMQSMGFGDSSEMKLNSGGGSVDFISEGDTTVAVLLEGNYAPGVQETLIIVAREIGKLA